MPPWGGVRPYLRHEALAAGTTPARLRGPAWRRPHRGVYLPAAAIDPTHEIAALLRLLPPDTVISHQTAAWLYQLPLPLDVDGTLHVTIRSGRAGPRPGVRVHRGTLADGDVQPWGRSWVTTAERTWLDLAATLARPDLVALTDAVLGRRFSRPDDLRAALAAATGRRGLVRARDALRLADPLAESPFESYLRLVLMDGGLRPVSQYRVGRARLDLALPEARVGIEYDGATHRNSGLADLRRQNELHRLGWVLLRYVAADILHRPDEVVAEVRATVAARS